MGRSAFGQTQGFALGPEPIRYPSGVWKVLDERFRKYMIGNTPLVREYTGLLWAEGPAWNGVGRYVVFSDIPNNVQMRWDESTGKVTQLRGSVNFSNGNTFDYQGRQISCEHGNRRVTRTEHDGSITVLAERFEGKRFNSPNDIVVRSDGSIWFTDPAYGIETDYEGEKAESEIGACYVYRIDPATGAVAAVITDMVRPNGLAFSLDERQLYVADTGRTHGAENPAHIRVFDVDDAGKVSGGRVFADSTAGLFDGFRLDSEGRIWSSAGDGIHCLHPDGTLIGKIKVPEAVANCTFGGAKRNVLYICATTSLYAVRLMVNGAKTV